MYSLAACRTVLPVGVTYHSYRRRPRSASRRDEHHGTWSHTRVGLADGTWSYSACDARQQADVLRLGHARQTRENS